MEPFRVSMLLSVVFAAFSAVESIYAYTFVYKIAQTVVESLAGIKTANVDSLVGHGKEIVFALCASYGLYGLSLLFSHITASNTIMRLKKKLIQHIGILSGGFHDSNPSGSLRKIIEKKILTQAKQ